MYNGYGFEQPDFSGVGSLAPMSSSLSLNLPTVKRGGMFGGKGQQIGEAISAALNGYLAAGGNPAGIAGLQQLHRQRMYQQEQATREQEYQRRHEDTLADYATKAKIDAQYGSPHYWEDNTGNLMAIGPDGQPHQIYKDPNPWKLVPNGMGGVVPVNMQALMGGGQPEILQTLPEGAKPLDEGGAGGNASGGFPGY
jgi:hypothetical protein